MTFTEGEQRDDRKAFMQECRQKAWGALCHAEWISKNLDDLLALYQKFQDEDRKLIADIKIAETAIDYHSVENRTKRKGMQEKRKRLANDMKTLGENMQRGQQSLAQLHQSAETSLSLAAHAEKWSWKDLAARKRIELRDIARDMQALSPKTETYKRLAAKHAVVLKEIEQLGAKRTAQK